MRTTSSSAGCGRTPRRSARGDPGRDVLELRQDDQHRPWAPTGAHGQRRDRQPHAPAQGPAPSPVVRGPAGCGGAGCAAGGPHGIGRVDLRTVRLRAGRLPAQPGRRHRPAVRAAGAGGRRLRRAPGAGGRVADGDRCLRPVPRAHPWLGGAAALLRDDPDRRVRLRGRCDPEAPDRGAPRRRRHARRLRRLPPRPTQGRPPRHPCERSRRAHARGVPAAVALPCRPRPQRHRRVGRRAGRRPALLGPRRPVPRQGDPADGRPLGPRARRAGRARRAPVGPRRRGRARGRRPARPRGRPLPRGHPGRRGRGDHHRRGCRSPAGRRHPRRSLPGRRARGAAPTRGPPDRQRGRARDLGDDGGRRPGAATASPASEPAYRARTRLLRGLCSSSTRPSPSSSGGRYIPNRPR